MLVRTAECYLAHAHNIYSRCGMSLDHRRVQHIASKLHRAVRDLQADIRIPPNRDWGGM